MPSLTRNLPSITSPEIERITLHNPIDIPFRLYVSPFLSLYPLLYYAYYYKYDEWIKSEEWTFVYCVLLGAGHALSFLGTRWNMSFRMIVECTTAESLEQATLVRVVPKKDKGNGEVVPLDRKTIEGTTDLLYSFVYQRDTYIYDSTTNQFTPLPYPSDSNPPLSVFQHARGLLTRPVSSKTPVDPSKMVSNLQSEFGPNACHIPIPKFTELFVEHAVAPFFVFQIFCVALWCLDEYWYYSLFTGFMLVVFECTVVFQVSPDWPKRGVKSVSHRTRDAASQYANTEKSKTDSASPPSLVRRFLPLSPPLPSPFVAPFCLPSHSE